MSTPELQALLANLRPRSQASVSTQKSVMTETAVSQPQDDRSPVPTLARPISTTASPSPRNLLDLLNFNSASNPVQADIKEKAGSHMMNHTHSNQTELPSAPATEEEEVDVLTSTAALEEQKGAQIEVDTANSSTLPMNPPSDASIQPENKAASVDKPLFTYKNPFEALKVLRPATGQAVLSTPRQQDPRPPPMASPVPSSLNASNRKILTPKTRAVKADTHDNTSTTADTDDNQSQDMKVSTEKNSVPLSTSVKIQQDVHMSTVENDTSQPNTPAARVVTVLTFPVKAFVSIALHLPDSLAANLRADSVMEISRLKKDFDQTDRSLAAASSKYIVYALIKDGGMRLIRQEDGLDRQVFKHSHDRIFSVSMCANTAFTTPLTRQAVLGTGVSGAVYHALLEHGQEDYFQTDSLTRKALVFPAFAQAEENTAGGALKTRAKRSSRHPEFFAIGRGRSIYIVWPDVVLESAFVQQTSSGNVVDANQLFEHQGLKIATGKAGKDFSFSEDDTAIVSLDKTGRLRFWDIRRLVDPKNIISQMSRLTVDTAVLSIMTATPAEKSWPTSVLFVDKVRPYAKGGPLRYVLVGFKQNHVLQLWDIALGKAVQELVFPHDNETDPICSVSYHPQTGIIAVGHPTRNSIFFVHLSVPRYNLSSNLSQALYIERVAAKDPDLPKPESTACLSGIRELSFSGKGQLRSIELLTVENEPATDKNTAEDAVLFELYIAHSHGVTCIAINHHDLGWNAEHKVVQSIDGERLGYLSVSSLIVGSIVEEAAPLAPSEVSSVTVKANKKKSKKAKEPGDKVVDDFTKPDSNGGIETTKTSEEGKTRLNAASAEVEDLAAVKISIPPSDVLDGHTSSSSAVKALENASTSSDILKQIAATIATDFRKELDLFYKNVQNDREVQDRSAASRQEAVLRAVSSALSTNVERTLGSIIEEQISGHVLPRLAASLSQDLTVAVSDRVLSALSPQIIEALPKIVADILESNSFIKPLTTSFDKTIRSSIVSDIEKAMRTTILRAIQEMNEKATTVRLDREQALLTEIQELKMQQRKDADQISELQSTMQLMFQSIEALSAGQAKIQEHVVSHFSNPTNSATSEAKQGNELHTAPPLKKQEPMTAEFQQIAEMMKSQKYEEGSIKWLQSSDPGGLFDALFVQYTPDYLATDVSSLVAFSIGITVADSLSTNTARRLEWIAAAFDSVDFQDREIIELAPHAPQLLNGIMQKLTQLQDSMNKQNGQQLLATSVSYLIQKAMGLMQAFQSVA